MDLTTFIRSGGMTTSELAQAVGVAPSMIYQWRKGIRSVPVNRCLSVERATNGAVTRRDLRPDDWKDIWPELADECLEEGEHA